jgi:short-subunit dehydrogenase
MGTDSFQPTCRRPGATETEFFGRADLQDTRLGQAKKADPPDVAKAGFEAMMAGEGDVVPGWQTKLASAIANVIPGETLAKVHARMAEPKSATS